MSYVVLARKWRPTRFEDLVGQEHVARTLANAIASGRIAHAFLFTGVRGVGKTTSARLLARALNCLGPGRKDGEPDPGPTATPCLECAACQEITAGSDVDVREIDGASYNGVDEVRKLQDSLPYRPTRDRYKIFIIDEVHMLSQSAWNAFLKTLEEPPPHVKFIFATTEVHKVPVTILSRVQRFDFKMIPARLIADRLRFVLKEEGISTDEAGLSIIAREAAGSMRDAMSLLDQVIAWNDQGLDGESVARVLGVASRKVLHDLAECLVTGDAARSMRVIEQVSQQGFDLAHVAKNFLELLRDLVVSKVCTDSDDLIDLPDEERRDVARLASGTSADDLMRLYQGFSAGFDDVLRGSHPRSALEMLLVRLCRRPPLIPLDDLLARLGGLEKRLGQPGGAAMAARRPPAAIPASGAAMAPNSAAAPHGLPPGGPQRPRGREDHGVGAPRREPNAGDGKDDPAPGLASVTSVPPSVAPPSVAPPSVAPPSVAPPSVAPPSTQSPTSVPLGGAAEPPKSSMAQPARALAESRSSPPGQSRNAPPPPSVPARTEPNSSFGPRSTPPEASDTRGRPSRPPPRSVPAHAKNQHSTPPGPDPESDPAFLMANWQEIVERVQAVRPEVSAVLEHAILIEQSRDRVVIGWPPNSVFANHYEEALLVELISTAQLERGTPVRDVLITRDDPRVVGRDTLSSHETAERARKYRESQAKVRNHPRVKDAVEILGARVVAIKVAEQ
jgi:DNA polymerase-3 subunit gamma/tau